MKKQLFLVLFLILSGLAWGQERPVDTTYNNQRFTGNRMNYNVSLGSQFSSMNGYGSAFTSWVTPSLTYRISPKFTLGGGLSISTTNYLNTRTWGQTESNGFTGNFTTATLFVNGSWLVNDRITIFGSAFKQFPITSDPLPYNPFNPVSRKGAQGVNFSIDYKIAEGFHLQAGFRYSEGVNPYYRNSMFGDPFNAGPMIPAYGPMQPHW